MSKSRGPGRIPEAGHWYIDYPEELDSLLDARRNSTRGIGFIDIGWDNTRGAITVGRTARLLFPNALAALHESLEHTTPEQFTAVDRRPLTVELGEARHTFRILNSIIPRDAQALEAHETQVAGSEKLDMIARLAVVAGMEGYDASATDPSAHAMYTIIDATALLLHGRLASAIDSAEQHD